MNFYVYVLSSLTDFNITWCRPTVGLRTILIPVFTSVKGETYHMCNFILNSIEQHPSWEANSLSARQQVTAFFGIRRAIAIFTRCRHWSLFWTGWIQLTHLHHISVRTILILAFHLRLGLPSSIFSSGLPIKMNAFLFLPECYMTHPSHLTLSHTHINQNKSKITDVNYKL